MALRQWLGNVGKVGEEESEDILLVASELVTNGVYHDGGDLITVRVERRQGKVAIEVTTVEHAPGRRPRYRDITDPLETGRGLSVVRSLSEGFSIIMRGDQRVTSCHVAIA